jgi:hypothetical protein
VGHFSLAPKPWAAITRTRRHPDRRYFAVISTFARLRPSRRRIKAGHDRVSLFVAALLRPQSSAEESCWSTITFSVSRGSRPNLQPLRQGAPESWEPVRRAAELAPHTLDDIFRLIVAEMMSAPEAKGLLSDEVEGFRFCGLTTRFLLPRGVSEWATGASNRNNNSQYPYFTQPTIFGCTKSSSARQVTSARAAPSI